MDTLFAADYDEHWGHINESHRAFLERVLALCPPGCTILDAACGTGKYWSMIRESGRRVVGIDQSARMLAQARAKFPDVATEKCGMQELAEVERYPGIICMDAMENVFPEDWSRVLGNFARALTPGGHVDFTVELEGEEALRAAYQRGRELGLPLVEGEHTHANGEGYHYYPALAQVRRCVEVAGLHILDEAGG
jgi:2-polyprenyl-3-methyl-5-hydroxy-6-metoxy-1,4-benzoquinol methylase